MKQFEGFLLYSSKLVHFCNCTIDADAETESKKDQEPLLISNVAEAVTQRSREKALAIHFCYHS